MNQDHRHVAVPNCTTILLTLALGPLARAFGLRRVVVSTYQAVSGAGRRELERMLAELRAELDEAPSTDRGDDAVPYAFNAIPWIGPAFDAPAPYSGTWSGEERKVVEETRRILSLPELDMVVTCVRVPVIRAHTESVLVELESEPTLDEVRATLAEAKSVTLIDGSDPTAVPTPRRASGNDGILLGRLRRGDRPDAYSFLLAGDQLRKGAALNAVQLAELQRSDLA